MAHRVNEGAVEQFAKIIKPFGFRNPVVLDTFGGSGSTLIACERTGRVCRCVELDPKYCDVIRRRWAEFVHGEGCDWQSLTLVAGCTSSDMPDMSPAPDADGSTHEDA